MVLVRVKSAQAEMEIRSCVGMVQDSGQLCSLLPCIGVVRCLVQPVRPAANSAILGILHGYQAVILRFVILHRADGAPA